MARTFIRQDTQIRNSDVYDDTLVVGSTLESASTEIETDLNAIRSQAKRALFADNAGDWFADINTPSALDPGAKRGITNLNTDLHDLERKRVLVAVDKFLTDITVGAVDNFKILALGELPPNTTAAVGAVTTRGTVAAFHTGTFGTHALDEVSGSSAITPKNLCNIVDSVTHDPILSSGRVVYALFQTETVTDGHTMTGTTPVRAQLSFVRLNAGGTDLEACPAADIQTKIIHYSAPERKALEDLNEQDFLRGAVTDIAAATTVTRQVAYNNQGTTPVDLTTNATLDLEGPGLTWIIRDDTQANLLRILEGSAGGTSEVQLGTDVDVFNVDAIVNDFAEGIRADTGGTRIDVGVNAGVVESTGANDLRILGAAELFLDDGNQTGSTWAQTSGIKLSDTQAEWDLFETNFGEVSLLNAINQAKNTSARNTKVYANVTVDTNANLDVSLANGNLDTALPAMNAGSYLTDYDVFLNGNLLRPGANAAANNDYYPGTTITAPAKLKFEFKVKNQDVLCVIPYA